jgi:hypothetical protein
LYGVESGGVLWALFFLLSLCGALGFGLLALRFPPACTTASSMSDFLAYFLWPLCGAALTFFAAPEKVSKERRFTPLTLSVHLQRDNGVVRKAPCCANLRTCLNTRGFGTLLPHASPPVPPLHHTHAVTQRSRVHFDRAPGSLLRAGSSGWLVGFRSSGSFFGCALWFALPHLPFPTCAASAFFVLPAMQISLLLVFPVGARLLPAIRVFFFPPPGSAHARRVAR